MKNTVLVILTSFYLLSCVGISSSRFYCCGVLQTTSLSFGAEHECGKLIITGDGCCKTTNQSFKVKDQHIGSSSFSLSFKASLISAHPCTEGAAKAARFSTLYTASRGHVLPELRSVPIYAFICTYRI